VDGQDALAERLGISGHLAHNFGKDLHPVGGICAREVSR
jgi:hypothetical protein